VVRDRTLVPNFLIAKRLFPVGALPMVPARARRFTGLALLIAAIFAAPARPQDAAAPAHGPRPDETLRKHDLKRSGTTWILPQETTLLKDFRDARAVLREVGEGVSRQQEMESGSQDRKALVQQLRDQSDLIGGQIAQLNQQLDALVVPPGGNNFVVLQRNQVAQQHNALLMERDRIINQLNALQDQTRDQDQDQKLLLNAEVAERSEKYMQSLIDLRKSVDEIMARYAELGKLPEVKSALDELSASTRSKQRLGPSKALGDAIKLLAKSEGTVRSETIKLRRDNGVFHVTAMLNGRVPAQMVFDTGAGVTTISSKLAAKLGLKPEPADRKITLKTADGTEVESRLTRLKSIRVGKFTVSDVEVAVMPESKGDVDSLLGQSFFKQFKVEFSHEAGTLALKKLEPSETAAGEVKPPGDEARPASKAAAKSRRPTRQPRTASKRAPRTRSPQAQADAGGETAPGGDEPN
jgi:clan AA aspartic protease (TIGR02281 family)